MLTIGIDASRANKPQRTGTEWYSYFLIEALKQLSLRGAPSAVEEQRSNLASDPPGPSRLAAEPADVDHRFILYSREPLAGDLGILPENFESRVLHWPPRYLWTQKRLSWEMLIRPPDVFFAPSHTLPIFGRARTVVTIHDVGFDVFPELYSTIDIVYHRFAVWYASHFADRIICPSEFTKREIVRLYGTSPEKIFVVPHGVAPADASVSDQSLVSGEYVLFVGRLEQKKNLDGIIKAFARVHSASPKLKLVLAGKPGHGWPAFQQLILQLGVADSVIVKGYISEAEKESLYRHARAFVFPTHYEGFGMPVLEAQVRGCPVITSRGGACEEVAGGGALTVEPRDTDAIAQAILAVVRDAALRDRLVAAGRANAERYTWQRAASETLDVLILVK